VPIINPRYAKELKDSTPTSSVTEAGESLLTVKEKEKNRLGINESRMSEITADPLLSFKLLRRHVFDLTKIEKILSNDYDRSKHECLNYFYKPVF